MNTATQKQSLESVRKFARSALTVLSFACIFGFKFIPPFEGLSPVGMEVMGIFLGAMILWLFININWSSIIVLVALMMTPLYTFGQVLSGSIGSWVVSFIVFSSALCYSLSKVGFFKRCAVWLLTRSVVKKGPWAFLMMMSLSSLIVGSFVSTLTVYMIFVPIIHEIFKEVGYKKGDKVPQLMTLMLLLFTAISNYTTPIAHVMPIMGMALYTQFTGGLQINFLHYTIVGCILAIVSSVIMFLILRFCFKADFDRLTSLDTDFLRKGVPPMTTEEKISVAVFIGVVVMWMAPGLIEGFAPNVAAFISSLGTPTPPMIGMVILSMIHIDGRPILDIGESLSRGVSWSTFMIVAATAILGGAVTHAEVGLTTWFGNMLAPVLSGFSPLICVLIIVEVAIIMTNFSSNAVTVTLITSIAVPMVLAGSLPGINPAALTFMIGLAACVAIATPAASAQPAIAAGDGWISTSTMFGWGMPLSLLLGVLLTFVGYPIAAILM